MPILSVRSQNAQPLTSLTLKACRGLLCIGALCVAALGSLLISSAAMAASTVDTFSFESKDLETRYRGLIAEIRCPKCQNVNIAGSDAPIAKDLRVTVHRLLGEGMSDAEILEFLQARYGDFVLYDPPVRGNTLLLWLLPLLGFAGAIIIIVKLARRNPAADDLSGAEAQRLDDLLAGLGDGGALAGDSSAPTGGADRREAS